MRETEHGAWITVAEAVDLAHRGRSTIYRWIKEKLVRSQFGPDGMLEVWGRDVSKTGAGVRRGRPSGTARPPGQRTGISAVLAVEKSSDSGHGNQSE